MIQSLMAGAHPKESPADPAVRFPLVRGDSSKGARMVDVAGMIRQASTPVKIHQLLRNGKKEIHLLSRDKIDGLIRRSIRTIVDTHRAAGAQIDPVSQRRMEAESAQEFDVLLKQEEQTAKAEENLGLSKLALDAELRDMRDDLAQQRELSDGRLPAEVERAMAESRFEKLYAHLAAMDRSLATLFSSKLYTYRQIQTLLRQAAVARKAASPKARLGPPRTTFLRIGSAGMEKAVATSDPVKGVPANSRRIEPFNTMALELGRGLDVGTVKICAAAKKKGTGGGAYNIQRNAFLDVHDDPFARKLVKYGIDYVVRGERGYIVGDAAFEFANIFERSIRRPMKDGMISSDEPDAILVVNHLVEELLGPSQQPGEICAFSVPGDPVDDDRNFIYHRSALESALVNLGYTPRPILESHLIVFAELQEQDYTGIGLSCGGGLVNVCVAYKSVPTLAFSTLRGGDWIDGSAAAALGLPVPLVCAIKEGGMDLMKPRGRVEEAIVVYYRHFIRYTLEMMMRKFDGAQNMPTFDIPIHLVCAGGTSMIPGFVGMFREEHERIDFPIEIAEIRMARNPITAVAAGCLQAALAETRGLSESSVDVAPAALERAAIRGIPMADPIAARHLARLQSCSAAFEGSASEQLERVKGWGRTEEGRDGPRR